MRANLNWIWIHCPNWIHAVLRIRIRDPVPFWPMDPGSGMGKTTWSRSRIRIRDEHSESYFRELRNNFSVNILKFFDADADPGIFLTLDPGSGMEKNRIRDKHPGSARLNSSPFWSKKKCVRWPCGLSAWSRGCCERSPWRSRWRQRPD